MCSQLILEFWMVHRGEEELPAQKMVQSKGRKQSQDIVVYVAVVSGKQPERMPELMYYVLLKLSIIIWALP